jgi:hypothetical protein
MKCFRNILLRTRQIVCTAVGKSKWGAGKERGETTERKTGMSNRRVGKAAEGFKRKKLKEQVGE